jgi:GR25 family glycosyltransferase involved in LPS biosynthesis
MYAKLSSLRMSSRKTAKIKASSQYKKEKYSKMQKSMTFSKLSVFVIGDALTRDSEIMSILSEKGVKYQTIAPNFLKTFPEEFNSSKSKLYSKRSLTLAEIGCAKSHLDCYQALLATTNEIALIFEDDAILHVADIPKILIEISNFAKYLCDYPNQACILSLYTDDANVSVPAFKPSNFFNVRGYPSGTVCYAINRNGAKILLEVNRDYSFVADWPKNMKLKFFLTKNKLIHHPALRETSLIRKVKIEKPPISKKIMEAISILSHYTFLTNRSFFITYRTYFEILFWPLIQWQVFRFFGRKSRVWGNGVKVTNKFNRDL